MKEMLYRIEKLEIYREEYSEGKYEDWCISSIIRFLKEIDVDLRDGKYLFSEIALIEGYIKNLVIEIFRCYVIEFKIPSDDFLEDIGDMETTTLYELILILEKIEDRRKKEIK